MSGIDVGNESIFEEKAAHSQLKGDLFALFARHLTPFSPRSFPSLSLYVVLLQYHVGGIRLVQLCSSLGGEARQQRLGGFCSRSQAKGSASAGWDALQHRKGLF